MRIGMEEPEFEHFFHDKIGATANNGFEIQSCGFKFFYFRDFDTIYIFHGKNPGAREIRIYFRNINGPVIQKLGGNPLHIRCFCAEIKLALQGSGKFFNYTSRLLKRNLFNILLHQCGQMEHDLQIHFYYFFYSGSLDFYGDYITVFQHCFMNLSNGRGCDGGFVKGSKNGI